jgi:TolB-like protein/Flp pilus assembly protein TadD
MPTVYRFGPFRLDTAAELLFRGAEPMALGQRAVALLRVLVERAGAPVSKDELIEAAWPGLAVEESNLTVQIAALRRVFEAEPGGDLWIETLSRRGYRYTGPAVTQEEASAAASTKDASRPDADATAGAASGLALPDKPSIAVLPFENLSGDPEQEYFADGLAEDIITSLSKFHWFFVIARNSSFTYKGRAVDVKQVGRDLGVRYVLEGSVRKEGNRVRITAQLIDAMTGRHVWADRYDRNSDAIFAVQDELTEAIVGAVAPSFITAEARRVARKPPESFDAWDYAVRGNWFHSRRNKEDNAEACRLFEKSLETDPKNTMALSGLALSLCWAINYGWVEDLDGARASAHAAARRAVDLDEEDAGAHVSFAVINFYMHRLDAGVAACRRALEINPNLALAEGWLGIILSWRGNNDEAVMHAQRSTRLSPRDTYPSHSRTVAEFGAGHYEQAVEWAKQTIEATPDFPLGWRYLAASLALLGRMEEARTARDQLLRVMPHENLRFARAVLPSTNPDRLERFVDGLRKAGVPE